MVVWMVGDAIPLATLTLCYHLLTASTGERALR